MKLDESIRKIHYTVIRSKRRTVTICIDQKGLISVRAPFFVNNREIEKIIAEKTEWIQKKQQQIFNRNENSKNHMIRTYQDKGTMPFQGIEYPMVFLLNQSTNRPRIQLINQQFQIMAQEFKESTIKEAFLIWYREQARRIYQERVDFFQQQIQEPYGQIRIKEQKTCFGSCSAKRNLNFNWKCVLAPPQVLDYIVVHELCHLKQLNHSKQFWMEVEKVMPDYKKAKQWLRDNEAQLNL